MFKRASPYNTKKILLIHLNQLGDLLFSLPAIKALREHFDSSYIVSFLRPPLAKLLESSAIVDEILLRPKRIAKKLSTLKLIKQKKFDLAVLFSQTWESVLYAYLSGIPQRVGFSGSQLSFLLTYRVPKYGIPSIQNNLRLIKALGITTNKTDYVGLIKPTEEAKRHVEDFLISHNINDNLIVISPLTSKASSPKNWSLDNFAKLITQISKKYGVAIIISGTVAQSRYLWQLVELCQPEHQNIVIADRLNLPELAALLSLAKCFIGLDSGAMHLAAALSTPVIALFGPTDPKVTGPPDDGTNNIIIKKDRLADIKVEEIMEAAEKFLG